MENDINNWLPTRLRDGELNEATKGNVEFKITPKNIKDKFQALDVINVAFVRLNAITEKYMKEFTNMDEKAINKWANKADKFHMGTLDLFKKEIK